MSTLKQGGLEDFQKKNTADIFSNETKFFDAENFFRGPIFQYRYQNFFLRPNFLIPKLLKSWQKSRDTLLSTLQMRNMKLAVEGGR